MAILADACKGQKGGKIISIVMAYNKQGDPQIQALLNRILKYVLVPLIHFIKRWIYYGEIIDTYEEFFIKENLKVKNEDLWKRKYYIDVSMIPKFIDDILVNNILLAGKSVNFLRKCCNDSNWLLELKTIDIEKEIISSTTFSSIKQWVVNSSQIISKKLIKTMFDKFNFIEHMNSIKSYLLLGQGDFLEYLMDLISPELSNPASQLFEHNLMSIINTAIGASNA